MTAWRRLFGWSMLVCGSALCAFGLWAIGAYIWGVVEVLNASDRSWIFWGLAILFLGVFSTGAGAALIVFARRLLSTSTKGK